MAKYGNSTRVRQTILSKSGVFENMKGNLSGSLQESPRDNTAQSFLLLTFKIKERLKKGRLRHQMFAQIMTDEATEKKNKSLISGVCANHRASKVFTVCE